MEEILKILDERILLFEGMKKAMFAKIFPCVRFKYGSREFKRNIILENKLAELKYIKTLIETKMDKDIACKLYSFFEVSENQINCPASVGQQSH